MNNELYDICELAKYAADMSIPLEAQPAPEAGSEGVAGMTNNATLSPTSQGASVYASPSEQMQLAKAKQMAACAMAKQAADEKKVYNYPATARDFYSKPKPAAKPTFMQRMKNTGKSGMNWIKNNKWKAGGGLAAAMGVAGAAAYAMRDREKQASIYGYDPYEDYMDKLAADAKPKTYYAMRGYKRLGLEHNNPGRIGAAVDAIASHARNAGDWVKNNKWKAGGGAAAALGIAGAAAYAMRDREKQASIYGYDPYEDYMDKLASIDYTGIYPEEAAYAMDSAEALYDDCLEKMAYAEELYADAADYLNYCDCMEKQANEFVPIAGSALGSAAGATAGAMIGGRFDAPRIGAGIGGAVGGAAGTALGNFVAAARQ